MKRARHQAARKRLDVALGALQAKMSHLAETAGKGLALVLGDIESRLAKAFSSKELIALAAELSSGAGTQKSEDLPEVEP